MSVYTSSRQQPYTLQQGQVIDDLSAYSWRANTVIVDNFSHQWLYIPNGNKFVAPLQTSVIVPLPSVSHFVAVWQSPPGIPQPMAAATDNAKLLFLEDAHPANSGLSAATTVTKMPDVASPAGAGTNRVNNIPLPPNTLAIAFMVDAFISNAFPTNVSILGHQTTNLYINTGALSSASPTVNVALIDPLDDAAVDISIGLAAGGSTLVHFWAYSDLAQVNVQVLAGTQLPVNIAGSPAPWLAALGPGIGNIGTAVIASIAGNGTITLQAGATNANTYLFELAYSIVGVAGTSITIKTTAGGNIGSIDGSFTHSDHIRWYGRNFGANVGITAVNNSATATGQFTYTLVTNQM